MALCLRLTRWVRIRWWMQGHCDTASSRRHWNDKALLEPHMLRVGSYGSTKRYKDVDRLIKVRSCLNFAITFVPSLPKCVIDIILRHRSQR